MYKVHKDKPRSTGGTEFTALIVHYGPVEPTLRQVSEVREWAVQTLVVSNDGTKDEWFSEAQDVDWLVAPRNLGYGGAINFCLEECRGEAVAILNTDLRVPVAVAKDAGELIASRQADVLGLAARTPDGRFLSGAGRLSSFLLVGSMRQPKSEVERCDWVTGAAMFARLDCVRRVRFEEFYFLGVEDMDFCVRARDRGYLVAVLSKHYVTHDHGSVIGRSRWYYYSARNPLWFARIRGGRFRSGLLVARESALLFRVLLADLVRRRGYERTCLMAKGIWHGTIKTPSPQDLPYEWEPVSAQSNVGGNG